MKRTDARDRTYGFILGRAMSDCFYSSTADSIDPSLTTLGVEHWGIGAIALRVNR
ncbi:MAG TPA: hypothetical protein VE944_15605 [Nostoc sp.]|uniref:hypothetical protein n=1 Tax=Nostoc sp. TaxID=1180 RepID=UPI002D7471B9|nr:hypothetical protein [Nostoc sp.]HYX15759.1 hypothetical protein [Nostoc sp.]